MDMMPDAEFETKYSMSRDQLRDGRIDEHGETQAKWLLAVEVARFLGHDTRGVEVLPYCDLRLDANEILYAFQTRSKSQSRR